MAIENSVSNDCKSTSIDCIIVFDGRLPCVIKRGYFGGIYMTFVSSSEVKHDEAIDETNHLFYQLPLILTALLHVA